MCITRVVERFEDSPYVSREWLFSLAVATPRPFSCAPLYHMSLYHKKCSPRLQFCFYAKWFEKVISAIRNRMELLHRYWCVKFRRFIQTLICSLHHNILIILNCLSENYSTNIFTLFPWPKLEKNLIGCIDTHMYQTRAILMLMPESRFTLRCWLDTFHMLSNTLLTYQTLH